jgi:hypothetical protein
MKSIGHIVHLSGILLALCALALPAPAQTFTTTAVQGTVYAAGGKPVSGTLQLTWPAFTTAAGQAVAAGRTSVTIGSDGFFSVNLAPNIGAMPAGLYYTAIYHLADGTTSTEYWVIPAAAQATLSQVRATVMPAAQAVQAVSKAYVDQTINEAVQGQMTVFGGSLTGPLYLAGDPNQPAEAADKHYVDGQFSNALPIGGGVLLGPVTGPQIGAVWQADQFKAADFGASLQLCIANLNPSYGGTCDARNFTGALSMAANLTLSVPNATVYLPCATISTAAPIVVPAGVRNVTLHGCATQGTSAASGSQGGTVILYSGSAAAIQVGDQTYAANTQGFHLDNLVVNTTAATASTAQALSIWRTQEANLSGLYLLGNANQTGITLDGTGNYTGGTIQDVHISGFATAINGIGHQTQNPVTTDWLNASTFVRLHIDCPTTNGNPQAGTTGINLQAGDGNTFTGGDVEGCATALHLGTNAQNNTLVGLRNENSTSQVVADTGSSYNNWITGGTMYTGQLTDNGTRNSFLDTFHRSFNSLNGDWYGSQQDATITNHYRLGTGAGNERGLYNRYQTDSGYRWTTGLSDAVAGEQFYQVLDELNNVYRLSIGQYNNGQGSANNQTVINAAGTGAVVLNGSNNAGTGGLVIGSGGSSSATVATIDKQGNAQFNGTLQVAGTSQSTGTMTVRNNADAEVDYYLWPGLTANQKGSLTYKDYTGNSQWYLVKDQSNNWVLNSAIGGLDSFKAYQSSNSGDTYVNASNATGHIRLNYETGAGAETDIYSGGSANLTAAFLNPTSIKLPGLAAGSAHNCIQIDSTGYLSNTGSPCSSGVGTVNTGSNGQIAYYSANGTAISGTTAVPLNAGGTGSATAAGALANLGAVPLTGGTLTGALTATQFNGPVSGNVTGNLTGNVTGSLTGNVSGTAVNVTGTVALANGGTGATTAAAALANLLPGVTTDGANGMGVTGSARVTGKLTAAGAVGFTSLAAGSGTNCVQVDTAGNVTNSGAGCGTATSVAAAGLTFPDASVQTTSQQGALTGSANDASARASAAAAQTAASAALPANGAISTGSGSANVVAFPGAIAAGAQINGYQYVTPSNSLAAANAALASTGGTLYQNVSSTLSSVQQIGAAKYPVEWKLSLAQGPVLLSTGGGIQLCGSSQMAGPTTFQPSGGSGLSPGTVYVPGFALVADVIAPCKIDNTQEAMGITDVTVLTSGSASPITITGTITAGSPAITGAVLPTGVSVVPGNIVTGAALLPGTQIASIVGSTINLTQNALASGSTATIEGAQMHSGGLYSGTVLRNISGDGTHTGVGLLVDGGIVPGAPATPGYSTDIEVDGYRFWGAVPNASGLPVVAVWAIPGSTGSSGISNITMMHGDAEGCAQGSPLMDVNGFSNGNGSGHISGFYGATLDLEAHLPTGACNGFHAQDVHTLEELNITAEAPGVQLGPVADNNAAAAVVINESYPGSTTQVHVSGYNTNWPTTVLDWVGAGAFTSLAANLAVGCSAITVTGIPANTVAPLAGQPIEIMDGPRTEVVYAAYGTGSGTTFSVDTVNTAYTSGCKYAHSYTSTPQPSIVWNPKWVHGPGPAGLYTGRVTLAAGNLSTDANGVVTVTIPGDSYVFEDRHIGEYVSISTTGADIATFGSGMVEITGLGAYCTSATAGQPLSCSNSQFQYQGPATASASNVNGACLYADTVATFDYTEPGDSTYVSYGPGNHIPEIRGSVNVREGANPAALTVSAFDSDNHEYYSSLFLGPGAKLLYPNATPNDLFSEAECSTKTGFQVNCAPFHIRTGPGNQNNLYLGAYGSDDYYVGYSDGLLHRIGTGSPAVPDIGDAFTWTGKQTFGAQTYFTATTSWSATGTATSGANYPSSSGQWAASVWNGSAAVNDSVTATYTAASGSNPQTTLGFSRSSSNTGYGTVVFSGGFDRIGTVNKANGQTSYLNFANVNHNVNYYLVDSSANQYLLAGPNTKGLTEGLATLSSGTVTVSTTAACPPGASCVYTLTDCGASGSTLGARFGVGTVVAGTSFVIDAWSTSKAVVTTDNSSVCWAIH